MNEITNEQRAERNRKLAEACGWKTFNEYGGEVWVENEREDGSQEFRRWFDFTRKLDDCARAEKKLMVLMEVRWRRKCGEWECCALVIDREGQSQPEVVAPNEALARSAALEAVKK